MLISSSLPFFPPRILLPSEKLWVETIERAAKVKEKNELEVSDGVLANFSLFRCSLLHSCFPVKNYGYKFRVNNIAKKRL